MKPASADRWNEWTALKGRNKPLPPSSSWWLSLSREDFQVAIVRETPRMSAANTVGRVSPIITGGQ